MSTEPHQACYVHEISVDSHGCGIMWSVLNPLWSPTVEHFVLWYCISYIQTRVEKLSLQPPDEFNNCKKKRPALPWQNEGGADVSLQLWTSQSLSRRGNTEIINIQNHFTQWKPDKLTAFKQKTAIIFINQA